MKSLYFTLATLICIILCSFENSEVKKTVINYKVTYGGSTVGSLMAQELSEAGTRSYLLESTVKIKFVVNVLEHINDVFDNETLKTSFQTRYVNGDLKSENSLHFKDDTYHVKNKDTDAKKLDLAISETVLSVYFNEPNGSIKVYSHYFQRLVDFTWIANHTFRVDLPNGSHSTYYYEGGKLQLVETAVQWGTLRFEKI